LRSLTDDETKQLQDLLPDPIVQVLVGEGANLSDLTEEDSFSYELIEIFLEAAIRR
jgi:hypothetical protein